MNLRTAASAVFAAAIFAVANTAHSDSRGHPRQTSSAIAPGLESGLAAWRKPDANGASCAHCHSPDGIELRAFAFTRADILRRAARHQNASVSAQIAAFLLDGNRGWHRLNPMSSRPLQPGGVVLPGKTPLERDASFAKLLETRLPELFKADIESTADAIRARDALLRLDPRTLPVGIPFNRLSEDGYHGKEHAILADWIPDVALPMTDEAFESQRAYLADPSATNLRALDAVIARMLPRSPIEQLAIAKYRSLLLLQQAIRDGGPDAATLDHISLIGHGNPPWEVADLARRGEGADATSLAIPESVLKDKQGAALDVQMQLLRLPWFWTGWALDPGLINSGRQKLTTRADYFTKYLWLDGPYPSHMAFMLTKKLVEDGCRPRVGSGALDMISTAQMPMRMPRQHFEIHYGGLLDAGPLVTHEPTDPAARKLFRKLTLNSFRMSLRLLEDELNRTGVSVRPEAQVNQIGFMRAYMKACGKQQDLQLCDTVVADLKTSRADYR